MQQQLETHTHTQEQSVVCPTKRGDTTHTHTPHCSCSRQSTATCWSIMMDSPSSHAYTYTCTYVLSLARACLLLTWFLGSFSSWTTTTTRHRSTSSSLHDASDFWDLAVHTRRRQARHRRLRLIDRSSAPIAVCHWVFILELLPSLLSSSSSSHGCARPEQQSSARSFALLSADTSEQ